MRFNAFILCHTAWFSIIWQMSESVDQTCKDVISSINCKVYEENGRCSMDYIKQNCKKTCRLCHPHSILYFIKEPSSKVAVNGQNMTFECQAKTDFNMRIKYFWKINHLYVAEDNNIGIRLKSDRHGTVLLISKVNGTIHAGRYQCLAMVLNYGSIISTPATLDIAYFRTEKHLNKSFIATLTKPFLIELPKYEAFPRPTFKWKFKGKLVDDYVDASDDQSLYVTDIGDLLIASVNLNHITTYRVTISHQALLGSDVTYFYTLSSKANGEVCESATIISFPTVQDKTASVGSNVTFESLAVATDCRNQIAFSWSKAGGRFLSSKRRLFLERVEKSSGGKYICRVQVVGRSETKTIYYSLRVNEKPKLIRAVDVNITIGSDGLLAPSLFSGVDSVSWYKDGIAIANSSHLYQTFANNSLRIVYQSSALNGFYQMFCENDAGTAVVTYYVKMSQNECGWFLSGHNGSLQFRGANMNLIQDGLSCSWLLQTASTHLRELRLVNFSFPYSNCDGVEIKLYRGPIDSMPPSQSYCYTTSRPFPFTFIRGPYILILLRTKRQFINGGFLIKYGDVSPVFTTPTAKATNSHYPTTNHSSTKMSNQVVTTKLQGKSEKQTTDSLPVSAIAGIVVGVLIIAIIWSICCYRKRLWIKIFGKKSVDRIPKESLPRFHVSHLPKIGSSNVGFQGEMQPSAQSKTPILQHKNDGMMLSQYDHSDYDTVGGILSSGDKHQGIYDVVGSTISSGSGLRPSPVPKEASIVSKLSNSSSIASGPHYHQLESGINITYESADSMKYAQSGSLLHPNRNEFARIPSGRSDTQYTPLDEDSTWASKENSIYESLTLERVMGSSSMKNKSELGGYYEPVFDRNEPESKDPQSTTDDEIQQNDGFRFQSCMLYESGTDVKESRGDSSLGEYSDPYELCENKGEQIYSEPL